MLDIRVFPTLLTVIHDMSHELRQYLTRMLVNCLYPTDPAELDVDGLEAIGGVNFIIGLYMSTDSAESRDNLFLVLFDYCFSRIGQAAPNAPSRGAFE